MSYGITNKDGKILIVTTTFDEKLESTVNIEQVLTIKQARAFARDIYAYCRIAEKEEKKE